MRNINSADRAFNKRVSKKQANEWANKCKNRLVNDPFLSHDNLLLDNVICHSIGNALRSRRISKLNKPLIKRKGIKKYIWWLIYLLMLSYILAWFISLL